MVKLNRQYKPWYGLVTYAIAIGALLVGQLVAGIFIVMMNYILAMENQTITTAISLIFQITNFAVFAIILHKTKSKPTVYLKMRRPLIGCGAGVASGVLSLFFFYGLAVCGQLLLEKIGYSFAEGYRQGILSQDIILLFLTVIAAPICEELIFRSALLSGLKGAYSGRNGAGMKGGERSELCNNLTVSLLCGLAFSLMHMNPEQTIYQFCLGFGASMLALSTGSVIPAIIMHATSNLIAALSMVGVGGVVRAFEWYERVFYSNNTVFAFTTILFAVIGAAVFIFVPMLIKKYCKTPATTDNLAPESGRTAIAENDENLASVYTASVSDINEGSFNQSVFGMKENITADPLNQNAGQSRGGKRMWLYFVGIGVCAFMWLFAFAAGLITIPA